MEGKQIANGLVIPPGRWVGVDFEGVLVHEHAPLSQEWTTYKAIPDNIHRMVTTVRGWVSLGVEVRIFTARVGSKYPDQVEMARSLIQNWCEHNLGARLQVTCEKDQNMYCLFDDRAFHVQRNTGHIWWPAFLGSAPDMESISDGSGNVIPLLPVLEEAAKSVPEMLRQGADLYEARNREYGDNYKNFGPMMAALFPEGLTINTADDWNRMGVFVQCVAKVGRYAKQLPNGGHQDSACDLKVYGAMLEELTCQIPSKK